MSVDDERADEVEDDCGRPCEPDLNRDCCAEYWDRMEREGFWNRRGHRWTAKGWKEITKWP
jgi:hypothetical protein